MKRSVLIENLRKFAKDNQMFDIRDQYDYIIARQIVDFLEEEMGMLPVDYQNIVPHLDWEPEDD